MSDHEREDEIESTERARVTVTDDGSVAVGGEFAAALRDHERDVEEFAVVPADAAGERGEGGG